MSSRVHATDTISRDGLLTKHKSTCAGDLFESWYIQVVQQHSCLPVVLPFHDHWCPGRHISYLNCRTTSGFHVTRSLAPPATTASNARGIYLLPGSPWTRVYLSFKPWAIGPAVYWYLLSMPPAAAYPIAGIQITGGVNAFLFGLTLMQSYQYFHDHMDDSTMLKMVVSSWLFWANIPWN